MTLPPSEDVARRGYTCPECKQQSLLMGKSGRLWCEQLACGFFAFEGEYPFMKLLDVAHDAYRAQGTKLETAMGLTARVDNALENHCEDPEECAELTAAVVALLEALPGYLSPSPAEDAGKEAQ